MMVTRDYALALRLAILAVCDDEQNFQRLMCCRIFQHEAFDFAHWSSDHTTTLPFGEGSDERPTRRLLQYSETNSKDPAGEAIFIDNPNSPG
jgi:hypothetical protein